MSANVFLSYAREDESAVAALYRDLRKAGFDPWMDRANIVAGDWRKEIKRGLRRSNFFLACLSTHTETPGEVLSFELDSALEIQRDNLEGEVYLIPVRLEPCRVPEKLVHLQWIELHAPGGLERLLAALRVKRRPDRWNRHKLALVAPVIGLFAVSMWLWQRPSDAAAFAAERRTREAVSPYARVGVTLWELRKPRGSEPPQVRYLVQPPAAEGAAAPERLVPVRLALDRVQPRQKVFLTVESSRGGYLYVIDRELRGDGTAMPARLIFPAGRVNGGEKEIARRTPVEIPDRFSRPNYFEVDGGPSYGGERLTVVVAPRNLLPGGARGEPAALPDDMVARWEKEWGAGVRRSAQQNHGNTATPAEAHALAGGALGDADPAPEVIFSAKRRPDEPIAAVVTLGNR